MRKAIITGAIFTAIIGALSCSGDGGSGPVTIDPPTGVSATLISSTSARVTWTASASDKVTSYNVFRNNTKLTEVTATSYTDNGLVEGTQYAYAVSANGPSGAVSSTTSASATITPPDVTPPTIVAFTPGAGATGIAGSSAIDATFSEAIDQSTLNAANFSVKTAGGATIAGSITYTASTRVAEFRPSSNFASNGGVSVTISGIRDVAGNTMANAYTSSFTVRDETPPSVTGSSPANGATGIAISTPIVITFSKAMNGSTVNAGTFTLTGQGTGAVAGTVSYDAANTRATFTPSASLQNSTTYTIAATSGMTDANGVALTAFNATFTTVAAADVTPPSVSGVSPAGGATNVALSVAPTLTFSRAMNAATLTTSTITLAPQGGSPVAASISYNSSTNVVTITPSSALTPSTAYTIAATTGVQGSNNVALTSVFTSSFTTVGPTDTTPPTVTTVSPANAAVNVSTATTVSVTFSEAMNASTITSTTVTLTPSGGSPIAATVSYNAGNNTATLTPTSALANSTTYTVSVTSGAKDVAGNAATPFSSTFATAAPADTTPPTVVSSLPANGATNVAIDQPLAVTFSEPMTVSTLNTTTMTLKVTATSAAVTGIVDYNTGTNTATFYPQSPLAYSTGYTLTVSTGAKDLAGNSLAAPATISITTQAAPDLTPPGVSGISPAGGATNVAVNTTVSIVFNRSMNASTINSSTITLTPNGGSAVAASVSFNSSNNTATLTPSTTLANSTTYTITITTGVQGSNNVALPGQLTSTFTTIAGADNTPPIVSSSNPANGATGFNPRSPISVTFNEAIDPSTINTSTFTMPGVCGRVTYDAGTRTASFQPSTSDTNGTRDTLLANNFDYTAKISTGVKDLAGNALASDYTIGFKTEAGGSGPFTLNGNIYSGTTCNSTIHVHLAFVQSGNTLTYSGACPMTDECYMYPLNQAGLDATGPGTDKLYPRVTSGSGTINGSDLVFNYTLENGRTFTLKATITANNVMSGMVFGPTLAPLAVEIRN